MKRDWSAVAVFLGTVLAVSFTAKMCLDKAAEIPRLARQEALATARDAAQLVREVFGVVPEVRIREVLVIGQSAPIAELAVIERDYSLTYEWSHTWMGSTKTVKASGTWRAKAGFDLLKPFRIRLDPESGRIEGELPGAEVLSIELLGGLEVRGESGWWNRLNDEDRSAVLREFNQKARTHVEASGLLEEAEAEALVRLQTLAERNAGRGGFDFRFRKPGAVAGPGRE
jgi:predicted Fe-S protein YdhL (DUF1289 family)